MGLLWVDILSFAVANKIIFSIFVELLNSINDSNALKCVVMKTFQRKLRVVWGKLIYRVLVGLGLTSVAFVFQACYAPYYSASYERCISGEVLSSKTQKPIQGVRVWGGHEPGYVETDEQGRFHLHFPIADNYPIYFADQSDSIAAYLPKDTIISDAKYEGEIITIYLNQP